MVEGLGLWGFRVPGPGVFGDSGVQGFGFWGSGFKVLWCWGLGFRV